MCIFTKSTLLTYQLKNKILLFLLSLIMNLVNVLIHQAYYYNSQHRSCLSYFKFLQEKSGNVEGIIILHLEIFKVSDFCIWPLYGCTVIVCVGWIKIFNNIDFQFLLPLI